MNRNLILLFFNFFLVSCQEVVVKIDDDVALSGSCEQSKTNLMLFFKESSFFLSEATDKRSFFEKVTIQLPSTWEGCQQVQSRNFPEEAIQVWIRNGSDQVWQTEGCGKIGRGIVLSKDVIIAGRNSAIRGQVVKAFSVNWLKYFYGVFDEGSQEGSEMYPKFYSDGPNVIPTSCTDLPISGNFTEDCFFNETGCAIPSGQSQISSSLLFSTDDTRFPEIRNVCSSATHNKVAPNQQNFLCNGRSPMDLIEQKSVKRDFRQPEVTFTQGQADWFYILLDEGENLRTMIGNKSRWEFIRHGLEQFFITLPHTVTSFKLRRSSNPGVSLPVSLPKPDNVLSSNIFHESPSPTAPNLSLSNELQMAMNESSTDVPSVILVITATAEDGDLTSLVESIKSKRIKIVIVTFSSIKSPSFLELTTFGAVYTIPEIPNDEAKIIHDIGIVMRQVTASLRFDASQDIISLSTSGFQNSGQFTISGAPRGNDMSITIVKPTTDGNINIELTSPSGRIYSSANFNVTTKWTPSIWYAISPVFEEGVWSYNIELTPPSLAKIYLTASASIGTATRGRSFLDQVTSQSPVNAMEVLGIPLFAHVDHGDVDDVAVVGASICQPTHDCYETILNDDGLTVPDVTKGDGIYSQFFSKLNNIGFYSTRFRANFSDGMSRFWAGPSFYVATPSVDDGQDNIPPSRVTDLRVIQYSTQKNFITLTWTSTGNDFNEGEVNYYKIFCGLSEDTISYDNCDQIRGTVVFGLPPGMQISLNRTIKADSLNRIIFFGVVAVDGSANESNMSNLATVYVAAPTTTTIATPMTTTSSDNSTESIDISTDNGVSLSTGEFVSIVASLTGVLLLFLFLIAIYACLKLRKKRLEEKKIRQKVDLSHRRASNPHITRHVLRQHHTRTLSPETDLVGSDSMYLEELDRPGSRGSSRHRRRSDFEYRVSRIETPPENLTVHPPSRPRSSSRPRRYSTSASSSSDDGEFRDLEKRSRSQRRQGYAHRSGQRGHPNHGFEASPLPEIHQNSKPVAPLRQKQLSRPLEHLSARDLNKSLAQRPETSFRYAGNGVLNQENSNNQRLNFSPTDQRFYEASRVREDSVGTTSTDATFQKIDYDTGVMQYTSTQERVGESTKINLRPDEPFNYIAFSQQLYGDAQSPRPKSRAVSFV